MRKIFYLSAQFIVDYNGKEKVKFYFTFFFTIKGVESRTFSTSNKKYLKSYQKISKEITNIINIKLRNELEKTNSLMEKINKTIETIQLFYDI